MEIAFEIFEVIESRKARNGHVRAFSFLFHFSLRLARAFSRDYHFYPYDSELDLSHFSDVQHTEYAMDALENHSTIVIMVEASIFK